MAGPVRVGHAVTSGTFSLDGETFDVENNIWAIGDDDECIVIDAPHSVDAIIEVVGTRLRVLHTPGHADTLFHGGPGATGRSFSDRPTLEASIRSTLFALPDETVVHTGHGDDTTIGAERAGLAAEPFRARVKRLPGEEAIP